MGLCGSVFAGEPPVGDGGGTMRKGKGHVYVCVCVCLFDFTAGNKDTKMQRLVSPFTSCRLLIGTKLTRRDDTRGETGE